MHIDQCKDKTIAERNNLAAQKWRQMTPAEQANYKEAAKATKDVDLPSLSDDARRKLIKKSRLQVMDQVRNSDVITIILMFLLFPLHCFLRISFEINQRLLTMT